MFREKTVRFHWKEWCWSWNSSTLATSGEELIFGKDWCWDGLAAGREWDNRGWDCWMASLTWWTWVWVNQELVMDREAQRAAIHGVAKCQNGLSDSVELIWIYLLWRYVCASSLLPKSFSLIFLFKIVWPSLCHRYFFNIKVSFLMFREKTVRFHWNYFGCVDQFVENQVNIIETSNSWEVLYFVIYLGLLLFLKGI